MRVEESSSVRYPTYDFYIPIIVLDRTSISFLSLFISAPFSSASVPTLQRTSGLALASISGANKIGTLRGQATSLYSENLNRANNTSHTFLFILLASSLSHLASNKGYYTFRQISASQDLEANKARYLKWQGRKE
jgi:hypothetical protein